MKPLPLRDPVPDSVDCCDSCGYRTRHLHKHEAPFTKLSPVWVCDLCFTTFAGNAALYPEQYPQGGVLQHVCFVGNVILDAIREKK